MGLAIVVPRNDLDHIRLDTHVDQLNPPIDVEIVILSHISSQQESEMQMKTEKGYKEKEKETGWRLTDL